MKRPLVLTILTALAVVAFVAVVAPVFGAPALQAGRAVIAQPGEGAAVREVVQVIGTATHPQFQRYQLFVVSDPPPNDQAWIFITEAYKEQSLGLLGTWDSRSVPDGPYLLRLRVVRADGQYDDVQRRITVANTRPAPTPTPDPALTPLPELPPTDAPDAPTAVVEPPTVQAPGKVAVSTIAPTATRGATANAAAGQTGGTPGPRSTTIIPSSTSAASTNNSPSLEESATSIANQLFSGDRLMATAKKAAMYTAGAFLAVGLFFGVKGILVWLWFKIKP